MEWLKLKVQILGGMLSDGNSVTPPVGICYCSHCGKRLIFAYPMTHLFLSMAMPLGNAWTCVLRAVLIRLVAAECVIAAKSIRCLPVDRIKLRCIAVYECFIVM